MQDVRPRFGSMPLMNDQADLKKLTYAQLRELLQKTETALAERRAEELKVLSDGYAKKLAAGGFSVQEGIDALRPYLPAKVAKLGGSASPTRAAKYANPENPQQTWGGVGKQPAWFKDQLAKGLTREEMQLP